MTKHDALRAWLEKVSTDEDFYPEGCFPIGYEMKLAAVALAALDGDRSQQTWHAIETAIDNLAETIGG